MADADASANFFWTSWKDASGRLNCFLTSAIIAQRYSAHLSRAYSLDLAMQSSRAPMTPHEIPYRALLRHENGDPRPPDLGSRASWEILTSSINTDPVMDARRASLFLIAGAEIPGVPCLSAKLYGRPGIQAHLLDQESSDFAFLTVLHLPSPDHKQASNGRIRDPGLGPIQSVSLFSLDGCSLH